MGGECSLHGDGASLLRTAPCIHLSALTLPHTAEAMTRFSNLFLEMWSRHLRPQPTLAVTAGRDLVESEPAAGCWLGVLRVFAHYRARASIGCGWEKRAGALYPSKPVLAEPDSDPNADLPSIHSMSINHTRLVKIILNTRGNVGPAGPSPSPWG